MRAGKLARWVGRLTGVAVLGVVTVVGGSQWAQANEEPGTDPESPRWESEDPAGEGPELGAGDSGVEAPPLYTPLSSRWE